MNQLEKRLWERDWMSEVCGMRDKTTSVGARFAHFDRRDGTAACRRCARTATRDCNSNLAGSGEIFWMSTFDRLGFLYFPVPVTSRWYTAHDTVEPVKRMARNYNYSKVSYDVTAAILVFQNNETAAMLVSRTNLGCWPREWKRSLPYHYWGEGGGESRSLYRGALN